LPIFLSSESPSAKLTPMTHPPPKTNLPFQPFQSGQIWRMENSHVHIGKVGKTLVEYKHLKSAVNRGPIRLIGKLALQDLLEHNNAILVMRQS